MPKFENYQLLKLAKEITEARISGVTESLSANSGSVVSQFLETVYDKLVVLNDKDAKK